MKKILLGLIFLLLSTTQVSAHNRGLVLGERTFLPSVPFAAGPGFLLPDSPFYFLDNWLDQVKVLLTFNPTAQANLRMRLAAEKLAEIKILLSRQNPRGLELALASLAAHVKGAKEILDKEAARGRDVSGLARALNEAIDEDQGFLGALVAKVQPEEKFLLKNAQVKIAEQELEIEKKLSQEEFENESIKELSEGVKEETEEASAAAKRATELSQELQQRVLGKQTKTSEETPKKP